MTPIYLGDFMDEEVKKKLSAIKNVMAISFPHIPTKSRQSISRQQNIQETLKLKMYITLRLMKKMTLLLKMV